MNKPKRKQLQYQMPYDLFEEICRREAAAILKGGRPSKAAIISDLVRKGIKYELLEKGRS